MEKKLPKTRVNISYFINSVTQQLRDQTRRPQNELKTKKKKK